MKKKAFYTELAYLFGMIIMSFAFFGFGVFEGVKPGTVIFALINGTLIGWFTRQLEKIFEFKNKFALEKYFR